MNIDTDVLNLIFLSEKIEAAFIEGKLISPKEAVLVRQCAQELLDVVPAPPEADPSQVVIQF